MNKTENQGDSRDHKNLDIPLLTVKEVASLLDETVHVIRNWLKDFRNHIVTVRNEAGYNLFDEKAIEVLRTIQRLHREHGYSTKQIEYYFSTGGKEFVPKPTPGMEDHINQELREIRTTMLAMQEQLRNQEQFNQLLTQKLDNQNSYIQESLKKRDEQLLLTMNEVLEKKKLDAVTQDQEIKKKWYQFWRFSK